MNRNYPRHSTAQYLANKYEAIYYSNGGNWCRISALKDQADADALAVELCAHHYQVRSVAKLDKSDKWEVIFR